MSKLIPITLLLILASSGIAYGQDIKKQVYFSIGTTAGISGNSSSINIGSGFALVIPINKKFFIRPAASMGLSNPTSSVQPIFPVIQAVGLLGLKVTPTFSVLGGGGYSFGFPENKPSTHLATAVISTSAKISDHLILFTPITVNEKGIGTNIQVGFSW